METLAPRVRLKAIEIANAVLGESLDEGKAIRVGIAKAKGWALHHPESSEDAATRASSPRRFGM